MSAKSNGGWATSTGGNWTTVSVIGGGGGGAGGGVVPGPLWTDREAPSVKRWYEYHTHIKSDRLVLIQVEATEEFVMNYGGDAFQQIVGWLNDTSLMRYSLQRYKLHTLQSQQEYLLKTFGGDNLKLSLPSRYWLIFKLGEEKPMASDPVVGSITSHVNADREVDLGVMLGREHGNGYAAEAMNMVINYFHQRRVSRFTCGMHGENDAMYKLATALGMKSYKDEGPYLYMGMTLELPPVEQKKKIDRPFPVGFHSENTNTKAILERMAENKGKMTEEKKSLVKKMRESFFDSSKWTGR